MNNSNYKVLGLYRGVSYHEEFDNVIDAMNYYEELIQLHSDIDVELIKITTLAKQGRYDFE